MALFGALALGAPPAVTLEVIPSAIQLGPVGSGEAFVVLRNPGQDPIQDIRLTWVATVGIDVKIDPAGSQSLPSQGALTWKLTLSRKGAGASGGSVHLRADYAWPGGGSGAPVPQVVLGQLDVRTPPASERAEVAVEVRTATSAISERRTGRVYVLMTNNSGSSVTIESVTGSSRPFIRVLREPRPGDPRSGPKPIAIGPGAVEAIAFEVMPTDIVPPGKQLLLFEIRFVGSHGSQTLVATQEVDVGVFGETEFSGALGVPAFLVLPGFIMVLWWGLLSKAFASGAGAPTDVKSREFVFFSVVLSVLMAFAIYPLASGFVSRVTGGPGHGRTYLDGYGTDDLFLLWMLSLALATAAFAIWMSPRWVRQWQEKRMTPAEKDSAVEIVRKLGDRGMRNDVTKATLNRGPQSQEVVLLEVLDPQRNTHWVSPQILYKPRNGADPLLRQIQAEIHQDGDLKRLARALAEGRSKKIIDVDFHTSGWLDGPYNARKEDVVFGRATTQLVDLAP